MIQFLTSSAEEAAQRSAIYSLLARLWLREVDQQLAEQLNAPPLRDLFVEAGGVLPSGIGGGALEQLAADYCQLLVGPKNHLPPYQSVWQSGQFCGTPTESMARYSVALSSG